MNTKLSKSMTLEEFDNGYWYAKDLKAFAKELGLPSISVLRKDELENAIIVYLRTGETVVQTQRSLIKRGVKDVELGLSITRKVVRYTSNIETKAFIISNAKKLIPDLIEKSGVRYRLNRWREEKLTNQIEITYGDLVQEYIRLNQQEEPFKQIPSTKYNNFLSDYLKHEGSKSRQEAMAEWEILKSLNIPNTYEAYIKHRKS